MSLTTRKPAAAIAIAAAFSMLATPVAALDLPSPGAGAAFDSDALNVERGGHRGHGGWHHDDDIDVEDVAVGVLIFGAIAAIAGAANNSHRNARYEESYPLPPEEADYVPPAPVERYDSRGIDHAVDICVGEVERIHGRVTSVDGASRAPDGWRISGSVESGEPYSCMVGSDGSIGDVYVGNSRLSSEVAAGQGDGADFAKAFDNRGTAVEGGKDGGGFTTVSATELARK